MTAPYTQISICSKTIELMIIGTYNPLNVQDRVAFFDLYESVELD